MLENAISCTDAVGSCARNVCECDKTFANNAAVLYTHDIWDDHHHGLDFNRVSPLREFQIDFMYKKITDTV
jgi:hypothetical protein